MDEVKEGQTIGLIKLFFGEVVEEIKPPIDGFCKSYYCEAPHIGSGQWRVFTLAARARDFPKYLYFILFTL
jgi:hypothetical protein